MAARLRFQQQRERRVAADIDPLDRIHLHGDVQAHDIGAGQGAIEWRVGTAIAGNVYAIFVRAATIGRQVI